MENWKIACQKQQRKKVFQFGFALQFYRPKLRLCGTLNCYEKWRRACVHVCVHELCVCVR